MKEQKGCMQGKHGGKAFLTAATKCLLCPAPLSIDLFCSSIVYLFACILVLEVHLGWVAGFVLFGVLDLFSQCKS